MFRSKTKILTLIEITRLVISLVTMLITAQFYPAEEYVLVVNVISISTLFSGVVSLGLPILVLTKPDRENQKSSEAGFLQSFTTFGVPFIALECISLANHGVALNKAFPLVLAEVTFAAVIQFNSRKMLANQDIRSMLYLVGFTSLIRLGVYGFAAFTERYVIIYWIYAALFIAIAIWTSSLSIFQAWRLRKQGILAIKESFTMGTSSMLMTALDNLPTYLATILLAPTKSAAFALALRVTSVSTIPGQSLTTAILPRMRKHAHNKTLQIALVGTATSFGLISLALLILKSGILFAQYPALFNYVLLFAPLAWARIFSISFGNILFIHGFAKNRVLYISCGLATLIVLLFTIHRLPNHDQAKLMIIACVVVEILITIAIVVKAISVLKQHVVESEQPLLDSDHTGK